MPPSKDEDERNFRGDAKRKQFRIAAPRKVAEELSTLMARKGYGRVLASAALEEAWRAAAGDRLSSHSRVGNLTRGVLEVLVRNSAALQELTFAKVKVVKKLIEACPDQKIRDVKFKVGSLE